MISDQTASAREIARLGLQTTKTSTPSAEHRSCRRRSARLEQQSLFGFTATKPWGLIVPEVALGESPKVG